MVAMATTENCLCCVQERQKQNICFKADWRELVQFIYVSVGLSSLFGSLWSRFYYDVYGETLKQQKKKGF